ncbi:MAG: DNA polymerase III subunit beta [Deltaproteobacteria bacterium]|nr:MAG: DNA polymerase III subunit beta [Deltaproteobacteria bacterium]
MDVTVEREVLYRALGRVQSVVDKRHSMSILTNALIYAEGNQLSIVGSDLEVSLEQHIAAAVKNTGRCAVSARPLFEIVREAPEGEIHLETTDNHWLSVSYGNSKFRLMGVDPSEYPGMPKADDASDTISIDGGELADMIRKTLFSVSTDDTRSNLTGVYLDRGAGEGTIRFVATDGHRLAMIDRAAEGCPPETGAILPRKGLGELGKLLAEVTGKVTLRAGASEAVVEVDDAVLSMRLVEGRFPDYQKVVPEKAGSVLSASRDSLLQTLRRVSILSSERARGVRFAVCGGTLSISANNPDLGEASEQLEVDYSGDDIEVGFNSRYLLDVLGVLPEESTVRIELGDEFSPGVVRGDDEGYRYVVMPMRI